MIDAAKKERIKALAGELGDLLNEVYNEFEPADGDDECLLEVMDEAHDGLSSLLEELKHHGA